MVWACAVKRRYKGPLNSCVCVSLVVVSGAVVKASWCVCQGVLQCNRLPLSDDVAVTLRSHIENIVTSLPADLQSVLTWWCSHRWRCMLPPYLLCWCIAISQWYNSVHESLVWETWSPIYKISYYLAYDYRKFIVRSIDLRQWLNMCWNFCQRIS